MGQPPTPPLESPHTKIQSLIKGENPKQSLYNYLIFQNKNVTKIKYTPILEKSLKNHEK